MPTLIWAFFLSFLSLFFFIIIFSFFFFSSALSHSIWQCKVSGHSIYQIIYFVPHIQFIISQIKATINFLFLLQRHIFRYSSKTLIYPYKTLSKFIRSIRESFDYTIASTIPHYFPILLSFKDPPSYLNRDK